MPLLKIIFYALCFFKFEVKKVIGRQIRRGLVKYGPVLTNARALSLSFKIKKLIPLISQ